MSRAWLGYTVAGLLLAAGVTLAGYAVTGIVAAITGGGS